jgi:hypothetical protein
LYIGFQANAGIIPSDREFFFTQFAELEFQEEKKKEKRE